MPRDYGLLLGLIFGVITGCLLLTIITYHIYQRFGSHSGCQSANYELASPIQATRNVSWRGRRRSSCRDAGQEPLRSPPATRKSTRSAVGSPTAKAPIAAAGTMMNLGRLGAHEYAPIRQSMLEQALVEDSRD
ncbi:hypothetical protein EJ03DRAFT_349746 [Teratosphaeria nubilosa]|uniref:Uncharacterized protein n=1 Tax=Teratosphaeria nubilosa TaxID=161662 RepID=A0A6G1LEQ5_9PEZI|nr:hypothetical protein EJ03DRAFT_349746 [Teratosphaeria nubilosa]